MAREHGGWEYVDGRPRWAPTPEIAMAEITGGLYGHEYEELRRRLEDLVRAAQRDAAEKIRDMEPEVLEGFTLRREWLAGYEEGRKDAADLIFPDYPDESDE
ncbi:hypothetical protein P1P75_01240 [Streptomyces sp. ID05-39B]|uniref:hypothetical protein n=1 Tax=Streptomyces sp. ID05-39B TaxID=3028664 RepID=UPI0029AA669A|nr:hypothetical protein [Streptomyces sp. ID05-39B]MDX3525106.1 hypothetical protein [Streptomyces sp. ID05-39B]